ncbi:MAG TPA: ribonuclease E activity regulator RraA [Pseudonocardia sp.]|uniref:ribonuclease E activity regulator RraA n=1 Tax=Pseudonocardia sp. TaxID=60912 RepID=UPI002CFE11D6|nr:ribonuclease E activity regulator RraA [Pseudonocardia sp.]HTF48286.1 ribonuclease E activity regulator RraA [Pseudonocardia sp.]
MSTADICDSHDEAAVIPIRLRAYGGRRTIEGTVETVRVGDSNQAIRGILATPGGNRILVVDGGGHRARFALVGDRLATIASAHGWQGLVIDGMVRDTVHLAALDVGVWARGPTPRRGPTSGPGEVGVEIELGGIVVAPGAFLAADADGVVVLPRDPASSD